ncbi:MAG TPA: hypothetical protein VIU85_07800 [Chthoniobacterales bacterium]
MRDFPKRRRPDPGVLILLNQPTIVFLTVCTAKRRKGLANEQVHKALVASWNAANTWEVGLYLIMPDHIHLFAGRRKITRSSSGSLFGSDISEGIAKKRHDFNLMDFTIAYVTTKVTPKNGNMFVKTLSAPGW